MEWYISVSFGELTLKGKNRHTFEKNAIQKILRSIQDFNIENYYQEMGKLYIKAPIENFDDMIHNIQKVFGIVYISPCLKCPKDMESMEKGILQVLDRLDLKNIESFKVNTNRVDKSFPLKSPQISAKLGGTILKKYGDQIKVNVHDPKLTVYVDVKENVYIYTKRVKGWGGLPIGSSAKGLLLLSGGIDSPVAGFMMAKRGVELSAIHFHSYPFTSQRGFEKVKQLANELSYYTGAITLYSINIYPIYKAIAEKCKERNTTILSRRFMMRIGQKICKKYNIATMITGENLGQVASQTIQSISVINRVSELPILRPLIAMEKTEIIDIARQIGTYDTSILPFEDCCTVFTPKRPVTKPRIEDIENDEKNLDIDPLIDQVISDMEIIVCDDESEN